MQHAINLNIEQVCLPSFTAEVVTAENPAGRDYPPLAGRLRNRITTTVFLMRVTESLNCLFPGCNPDR